MNIAFLETQEWEKAQIKKVFPQAKISDEPLSTDNIYQAKDAEIISTFIYSQINKECLDKLLNLKFISTRSTGYDHIDIQECKKRNIIISNVPEYGSSSVAEFTFALLLNLTRKINHSVNQIRQGDFSHNEITGIDLDGKTLGIIGLGKIGKHILRIAKGFNMQAIVYTRIQDQNLAKELGFIYADLKTLLNQSDIITLHLPLTIETKHIINLCNIKEFKKGSFLLNTARGGLIETEAMLMGLEKGILSGIGLDVLEEEKELMEEVEILTSRYQKDIDYKALLSSHALMSHPQVIITPHNAFNSKESLAKILKTTIDNIQKYSENSPINIV